MKGELKFYASLIVAISILILLDSNVFHRNSDHSLLTKVIDVSAIQKLQIDLPCNIYIAKGEKEKLVFEGPANSLNNIEAVVEKGTLKISEKPNINVVNFLRRKLKLNDQINIYINLPDLNKLDIASNAKVFSAELFSQNIACRDIENSRNDLKMMIQKLALTLAHFPIS